MLTWYLFQAACGVANKPKGQVIDIDAADVNNDLAGVEYVEDIYKFYKLVEVCIKSAWHLQVSLCVLDWLYKVYIFA